MTSAFRQKLRTALFDSLWRRRAGLGNALAQAGRVVRVEIDLDQYRRIAENNVACLGLAPSDLLVDIGCSNGALSEHLVGLVRHAYLVDRSAEQLELAKTRLARYASRLTCVNADIADTRLPAALADKVHVCSVVHYLESHDHFERALAEINRILKPGATALVADIPLADLKKANSRWNERLVQPIYVDYGAAWLLSASNEAGFDARIAAQPADLPFSRTRIDLVLRKR